MGVWLKSVMDKSDFTDSFIDSLIAIDKTIKNPGARWKDQKGSRQKNYSLKSTDDLLEFSLYLRQNLKIENDFSCGLVLVKDGTTYPIVRYNGSAHVHENPIESERFEFQCHIHKTTERYASSRYKLDHYASQTDTYSTLDEALTQLMLDCKIGGLKVLKQSNTDTDEQQDFFE